MTINEGETRTGLERATVRYYEKEGLLSPARGENGYRNYSESDLEKLRKIRLLRALDFSLEDIRAMDADGSDFADRLRARSRSLDARAEDIADARRVIEAMLSDGAEYGSLQSGLYLRALSSPAPALPEDAPPEIEPEPETVGVWVSPWRRFFARGLDRMLCGMAFLCFWTGVLRSREIDGVVFDLLSWLAVLALTVALEPVLLTLFGTTPGKLALGIRVWGSDGRKLRYKAALRRTVDVLAAGEGLNIPVVSLYTNWRSFKSAEDGETLSWEYDSAETAADWVCFRHVAAWLAVAVLAVGLTVGAAARGILPRHRGDLTVRELCENVNDAFRRTPASGFRLNTDGTWSGEHGGVSVVTVGGSTPYTLGPVLTVGPGDIPGDGPVEFILDGNTVTGLTYRVSRRYTPDSGPGPGSSLLAAGVLIESLVGADPEAVPDVPSFERLERSAAPEYMEPFDLTFGPWRVAFDMDLSGEGTEGSYSIELRISKF